MLDRGLEHTLVFVLWDPWALGESMPESLGESSLRALYGHLDSWLLWPPDDVLLLLEVSCSTPREEGLVCLPHVVLDEPLSLRDSSRFLLDGC